MQGANLTDQVRRTMPDKIADLPKAQRGRAKGFHRRIHCRMDRRQAVDQRAIQVENDRKLGGHSDVFLELGLNRDQTVVQRGDGISRLP